MAAYGLGYALRLGEREAYVYSLIVSVKILAPPQTVIYSRCPERPRLGVSGGQRLKNLQDFVLHTLSVNKRWDKTKFYCLHSHYISVYVGRYRSNPLALLVDHDRSLMSTNGCCNKSKGHLTFKGTCVRISHCFKSKRNGYALILRFGAIYGSCNQGSSIHEIFGIRRSGQVDSIERTAPKRQSLKLTMPAVVDPSCHFYLDCPEMLGGCSKVRIIPRDCLSWEDDC
ncbi:hypothetical protein BDP67DRAFT_505066 [Colletotrichum lupini]|nr:hypothetical protein BDP67DRAFT_505066 [Colletotrichum lupini]